MTNSKPGTARQKWAQSMPHFRSLGIGLTLILEGVLENNGEARMAMGVAIGALLMTVFCMLGERLEND